MLREIRNLDEGAYIEMNDGLLDCKNMGIITGQFVPRYHPSVQDNPMHNYFHQYMVAVSGMIDEEPTVEALVKCLSNIHTCCYCILGVSDHYVVLTKSALGKYALYEGVEKILNDDTDRGAVLTTSDTKSAVQMVMHYGHQRHAEKQAKHKFFNAAIIKPSECQSHYAGVVTIQDWRVFYETLFSHGKLRSNRKIINQIESNSVTLNDLKRLKEGEWLNDVVINTFFTLLSQRDTKSKKRTHFFNTHWLTSSGLEVDFEQEDMTVLRLQVALSIMGIDSFHRFFGDRV